MASEEGTSTPLGEETPLMGGGSDDPDKDSTSSLGTATPTENNDSRDYNSIGGENLREYTEVLKGGVTPDINARIPPPMSMSLSSNRKSMHEMSNWVDQFSDISQRNSFGGLVQHEPTEDRRGQLKKAYSVSADGSISYLTPLQMGRHELYENLPFTAVFGMQRKERSLSQAFASYAADLDVMEADQKAIAATKKHLSSEEFEKRRSYTSFVIMDELELDTVMLTAPMCFAVLVATCSQFLVGYNTGVMNAPESVVFPGHSTGIWSLAVAAFAIGAPAGANVGGALADNRGRRGALLMNTYTFLIGGLLQTFAYDMYGIIISRLIIGYASGVSSVLVPIYLGELAPPTLRGTLGTLAQFGLVVGILVSDLLAFQFATMDKWRYLFAVTAICAVMQLLCAPWLLESPRWLLSRDRNSRKARYIIKKLRGLRYDHEIETEVDHFVSAMQVQSSNSEDDLNGDHSSKKHTIGYMELFRDTKIRLLVISCLVLQMSQQLCGINAVFYYSTSFFEGVIENPLVGTTLVGAINVVATYVALLLMDKCGRRTLILWSSGGMFICCIVLVFSLLHYLSDITALVAVNLYVSFFEIGLGPIPWLIVAEMFDAKYVSVAMSASCQLNWACNIIVGMVFPYMDKYLGPYSFVPFACVLLLVFCFTLCYLPETQGTTPEELQAELVRKNSSVVYHNMNIESENNTIDMEWRMALDQLKTEEEAAMNSGTYNYGFQPIEEANNDSLAPGSAWMSNMSGHQ